MNFAILDNQNGIFTLTAVDAAQNPLSLPADTALVSANPAVLSVGAATSPGVFPVKGLGLGQDGTVILTASGTNAAGQSISTQFTFVVSSSDVAVGFTATLTGVATNAA